MACSLDVDHDLLAGGQLVHQDPHAVRLDGQPARDLALAPGLAGDDERSQVGRLGATSTMSSAVTW